MPYVMNCGAEVTENDFIVNAQPLHNLDTFFIKYFSFLLDQIAILDIFLICSFLCLITKYPYLYYNF